MNEDTFFPMIARNMLGKMFSEAVRVSNGFKQSFHYPLNLSVYKNESNGEQYDGIIIEAALAGFDKDEIEVTVEDCNHLTLKVEKNGAGDIGNLIPICQKICQKDDEITFTSALEIDAENTKVTYKNGLLVINAPFVKEKKNIKKIEVK